jgi:hypothetical protein
MRQEAAKQQTATASAAQASARVKHWAGKPKRCILPWCEPAMPGVDCVKLKRTMELADQNQVDWSDDDDVCHTFLTSGRSTGGALLATKPKMCILPWCEPAQPGVDCEKQAQSFESRDKGLVDWTDDEGACRTWLMPRNSTHGSRSTAKPKKCILPWCEPAQPGVDCEQQANDFEARDKGLVDWTDSDDACHAFHLAGYSPRHGNDFTSTEPPSLVRRSLLGRPQVCIAPLCWNLSNKACEKLEDQMEKNAKNQGVKIDYTTDDDACGKALAARNTTSLAQRRSGLSARRANSLRQATKVCILPFCKNKTTEECKVIEQDMEKAAKDHGGDIDYTTEDSVCKTSRAIPQIKVQRAIDAMLARTRTSSGKRAGEKFCVSDFCKSYELDEANCKEALTQAKELAEEHKEAPFEVTTDNVCIIPGDGMTRRADKSTTIA